MLDYFLYKLKEKLRLEEDDNRSDKIIENSVIWAMSAALIPVPLADVIAVSVIQTDMVRKLAEAKGLSAENATIESWLGSLSGGILSKLGAQALKLIPGWGSVAGGLGMAVLSGASTYAAGKTFAKHFDEGGTLENFDASAVKDFYEEQLENGRELAKKMKDEVEKRAKKAYAEFMGESFEDENEEDFDFEEVTDFEEVNHQEDASSKQAPSPNNTQTSTQKSNQAPKTQTPPRSTNSSTPNTGAGVSDDLLKELRQLADLRDKGILTKEEFQRLKTQLMKKL